VNIAEEAQNGEPIITAGAPPPAVVPEAAPEGPETTSEGFGEAQNGDVKEGGSDYSEGGEEDLGYEKIDTPDGFKIVLKNPEDGMKINIPQLIKKHGSKFLKDPNAPLNLKIDRMTKGDGKGTPTRVDTEDGFKLVFPGDEGFDVNISEEVQKEKELGSDYSESEGGEENIEKIDTPDGFKLAIKNPKDGMKINIPEMIKKYGSKYLKNPDAPLNLKIDSVTKGDGQGSPKRIKTEDGFKLVYPGDEGFDVNIAEEAQKGVPEAISKAPETTSEEPKVEEGGSDYSEGDEEGLHYEKIDTPDGFKIVLKNPKDGMKINIPKMIKKYGRDFLKNPDAPMNLKIDRVTKGDGKGTPERVETDDGFKLVYPGNEGFDINLAEEVKKVAAGGEKEEGNDYGESSSDEQEPEFIKTDTPDGFKLVIKHPKDGMNINIPKLIKRYGSKFLKHPNAPLNLKIDKVTKGDGKGGAMPEYLKKADGFKLVYPKDNNFNLNIDEAIATHNRDKPKVSGGSLGAEDASIKNVQQTKDGFKVTLNPKNGMQINIPKMIKKYGRKFLANPDSPMNLKIDRVTKGDGSTQTVPDRVRTEDGFKLVYPRNGNFDIKPSRMSPRK